MNRKKKWKNISNNNTLLSLKNKYFDEFENKNDFYELIFYIKGWTKSDCIIHEIDTFGLEEEEKFVALFEGLKTKPLQYLVNEAFFFGNKLFVDERVLIPRRETELLVENVLNDKNEYATYVDVCTGSGCIAIAIANSKKFEKIYAADISSEALEVAKINFATFDTKAEVLQGDFLKPLIKQNIKANLLTINPPYIDEGDPNVEEKVRNNEPHIALFAEDSGLAFYKKLFDNLESVVDTSQKFKVLCEFGFKQKNEIKKIFLDSGLPYKLNFQRDYSTHWRYFILTN
jgi:release factor glutamine methyltransferase